MPETILKGLQPGQTYLARVRSKNENGETSQWSNILTVAAPGDPISTTNSTVRQYFSNTGAIYASSNVFMNASGIYGYDSDDGTLAFSLTAETGRIFAERGTIGGWKIRAGMLTSGSGTSYIALNSTRTSRYAMWTGAETAGNAPFWIKDNGDVKASNIIITGTSTIDVALVSSSTISLLGSTSGSILLKAPNVAGNNTITFPAQTGSVALTSGSIATAFNSASLGGYSASSYTRSYTFEQQTGSTVWNVNHNLGYRPSVTVEDYGKIILEGDLSHTDANNLVLTFSEAVSGYVYLS
jgi:hypothetical protein